METIQRPIQEINQNGKTKPDLDYTQESLRYRAETELESCYAA